jgi:hypothetical protein
MLKREFNDNGNLSVFGIMLKSKWKRIDLELEYHERTIKSVSMILNENFKTLSSEFQNIQQSNISKEEKELRIDDIEIEGNNFENYYAVYYNSFFINICTIIENSLLNICEESHCYETLQNTIKKKKESDISRYFRVIEKVAKNSDWELKRDFNVINSKYRKLRNRLVHNRYLCTSKDVDRFK